MWFNAENWKVQLYGSVRLTFKAKKKKKRKRKKMTATIPDDKKHSLLSRPENKMRRRNLS